MRVLTATDANATRSRPCEQSQKLPESGMADSPETQVISASRDIAATPEAIFDILANPERHREIDGSETVGSTRGAKQERLQLGSKFGMSMTFGPLPYAISNEVVEFEEGKRIAWRHFGHHVWRYELEPTQTGTLVTESFDWSNARIPPMYKLLGYIDKHEQNIPATLEKLESVVLAN